LVGVIKDSFDITCMHRIEDLKEEKANPCPQTILSMSVDLPVYTTIFHSFCSICNIGSSFGFETLVLPVYHKRRYYRHIVRDRPVGTPTCHHIHFTHSVFRFTSQLSFLSIDTNQQTDPDKSCLTTKAKHSLTPSITIYLR